MVFVMSFAVQVGAASDELAVVLPPITAPAQVGPAPAPAVRLGLWSECVAAANAARAAVGVAPLTMDLRLAAAATAHSGYQASRQLMSHVGSGGSNLGDRLTAVGYHWFAWGENVAAGQSGCASVMDAWLASAPHRANIMNPSFRHIGVGMVLGGDQVPYWTMDLAAGG